MIVVTGPTGKLGRLVTRALLERAPPAGLAVAVRNPLKAADLAARGVQVRHIDSDRPETLSTAFNAGEKVLLISANEVKLQGAGLPAAYGDALVDADLATSRGELDSDSQDLPQLIGRPASTMREAIASALREATPVR